jgi:hypothetical protein
MQMPLQGPLMRFVSLRRGNVPRRSPISQSVRAHQRAACRLRGGRLREQVAHGPRFVAQECAEQRVDSSEEPCVCRLVHAE